MRDALASVMMMVFGGTATAGVPAAPEPEPPTKKTDSLRRSPPKSLDGTYDLPMRYWDELGREPDFADEPLMSKDEYLRSLTPQDIERMLDKRLQEVKPEKFRSDLMDEIMRAQPNSERMKFLRNLWQELRKRSSPPKVPHMDGNDGGEVALRMETLMPEERVERRVPVRPATPEAGEALALDLGLDADNMQGTLHSLMETAEHVGYETVLAALEDLRAQLAAARDEKMLAVVDGLIESLEGLAAEKDFHESAGR